MGGLLYCTKETPILLLQFFIDDLETENLKGDNTIWTLF